MRSFLNYVRNPLKYPTLYCRTKIYPSSSLCGAFYVFYIVLYCLFYVILHATFNDILTAVILNVCTFCCTNLAFWLTWCRSFNERCFVCVGVEVSVWKQKCESGEGGVRSEELDELKRKLMAKLQEAESQLETALGKAANLEKSNHRLKAELEDLTVETERVSNSVRVHVVIEEHTYQLSHLSSSDLISSDLI